MHGHAIRGKRSRTYGIWAGIKTRCDNPNSNGYENYGARGISYDPSWRFFENFLADMGEAPDGLTIERIDNDKGYSKSNCRWATRSEQSRNRQNTIEDGRLKAVALEKRIPASTLYNRVAKGISLDEAIAMGAGGDWRRSELRNLAEANGLCRDTVAGRVRRGMAHGRSHRYGGTHARLRTELERRAS